MTRHTDAPTVAAQQFGATPPDVAGLVERLEGYVENCPPGFEKEHHADMIRAATALRLSAGGGVPDIETIARAIDPDVWADDLPVPTRADVVAFHEGRARSIAAARRVVEAALPASPTVEAGHVE